MIDQPKSAFQGERGGDAYDAELLALLKGISNKSSASDRFAGGDDEENNEFEEIYNNTEKLKICRIGCLCSSLLIMVLMVGGT